MFSASVIIHIHWFVRSLHNISGTHVHMFPNICLASYSCRTYKIDIWTRDLSHVLFIIYTCSLCGLFRTWPLVYCWSEHILPDNAMSIYSLPTSYIHCNTHSMHNAIVFILNIYCPDTYMNATRRWCIFHRPITIYIICNGRRRIRSTTTTSEYPALATHQRSRRPTVPLGVPPTKR